MKHPLLITLAIIILYVPVLVHGEEYSPLVGVPGVDTTKPGNFDTYINSLYALSISIAALLAVIKITIAGVKWMMSDIVTSKSEAKKDIEGAIIGLLIILAAVLILFVINPNLTKVTLGITELAKPPYTPPAVAAGGGGEKARPVTPEGGQLLQAVGMVTEDQRKTACETVDPDRCGYSTGQFYCYKGTYNPYGNGTCIIDGKSNVQGGEDFDCNGKFKNKIDACDAAIKKCIDAGLKYELDEETIGDNDEIHCLWK